MPPPNIYQSLPDDLADEWVETMAISEDIRVERIVSRGHASPAGFWYDQSENEYVLLLKGSAVLRFKGKKEPVRMVPGDYLVIPKHRKHRVESTDPAEDTVWLAIFYK